MNRRGRRDGIMRQFVLPGFGKNLYRAHPLMMDPGTFWRCRHGTTGHHRPWWRKKWPDLHWYGCIRCFLTRWIR